MPWKSLIRRYPALYFQLKNWHERAERPLAYARNPICRVRRKPLAGIPASLQDQYSMGGEVQVLYRYSDDSKSSPTRYSGHDIEDTLLRISGRQRGHYGEIDGWLYSALQKYPIQNQRIAIMGSADQGYGPWYECVCLHFGGRPTTVDYNAIVFDDSRLQFVQAPVPPSTSAPFDCGLSISAFEHDGLGRYGDPLDPDADLKAMRQMKKLVRKHSLLYLSVPIGKDKVVFNLHRIYGRARLGLLLDGWTVVDSFGFEDAHLDRDTGTGWEPARYTPGPHGVEKTLLHPQYPVYEPVWVLRND